MEGNGKIFVDSSFWVAFFNPRDSLNNDAIRIQERLASVNTLLVISNFVFLEVVTIISQKVNRNVAIKVGKHLLESPSIHAVVIGLYLQMLSWRIFQEIKKKNISFIDCSNVAVINNENISHILTFDISDFTSLSKKYEFKLYRI